MKHTPTPYTYSDSSGIADRSGIAFAQVYGERPQQRERAEFVCRACNNHDALLAACRDAKDRLLNGGNSADTLARLRDAIRKAEPRAAIAKAKP